MDIGLLKTFLEVNRTRHFGQAAENLFLTQSAISARIRLLEQTVGLQLFTRTRNNIELTPAGQKLLKHADTILNTWNRARQEIAIEDDSKTPFAVGGVPSLWDILLQDWLNRLLQKDDKLVIHAEVHGAETLVRRLIDGILDVAFMFESLQMTELLVDEVGDINLVMVSSKPDLSAKEAVGTNYILVDWGTSFSISHAQHFPDIPSPRLHVHIGRLAYNYILQCGRTAYLAESMVRKELDSKSLFVVNDAPVIKRTAYAAYLPNSERLDTIKQALSGLLDKQ
jgi:DNA-binding transcriptional LysR family regulator